jgi:hypothetical protein
VGGFRSDVVIVVETMTTVMMMMMTVTIVMMRIMMMMMLLNMLTLVGAFVGASDGKSVGAVVGNSDGNRLCNDKQPLETGRTTCAKSFSSTIAKTSCPSVLTSHPGIIIIITITITITMTIITTNHVTSQW